MLLMLSFTPFDGTGNPEKASSTRLLEKADLNGLRFLLTIFIINHMIPTPIHPVSVFNDSTKVNCAQVPTRPSSHACSNSTYNTNTTSC